MKKNLKCGLIIQARMGSSRLKGKVMLPLANKLLIDHVIERSKQSKFCECVCVAIPDTNENDILFRHLRKNSVLCYRGNEDDVLSRFQDIIEKQKLDIVVRITADNPLFDYTAIDRLIDYMSKCNCDYATEVGIPYGANVEVIRAYAILNLKYKPLVAEDREHVTRYIINNADEFKVCKVERNDSKSHVRITVDTELDYKKMVDIYNQYYKGEPIDTYEVIEGIKND